MPCFRPLTWAPCQFSRHFPFSGAKQGLFPPLRSQKPGPPLLRRYSQAPELNEGQGWRGRVCTTTGKGSAVILSLLITHRLTRLLRARLQKLVLVNCFRILITSLQPSTWHVGILQNFPKHPASGGPHGAWRSAPLGATGPPAHHGFTRGSLCS